MKTITISGDAYRKLESMKSGRSFSETIEGLIAASTSSRIDHLLELSSDRTGREDELSRVVEGIRRRTRARAP
jgi:predicted CopG family antitoxin